MNIHQLITSTKKITLENGVEISFEAIKNKDISWVEEEKENGHKYIERLARCCIKKVSGVSLQVTQKKILFNKKTIKKYEVEFDENGIMTEYSYAVFCKLFEVNKDMFIKLAETVKIEENLVEYIQTPAQNKTDSSAFFESFTNLDLLLYNFLYDLCFLTMSDTIEIISSLKYEFEEEFRCKKSDRFSSYGKSAEIAREQHNIVNFCNKQKSDTPPSYKHKYKYFNLLTCPCSFQKDYIFELIELENGYNKFGPGYIYTKKSYLDLSVKLTSSLKLVRSFLKEKEKEELQKQQQKVSQKIKGK